MTPAVPLLLGAASCAALGILSRTWLPYADAGLSDGSADQHLAATLAAIAWYVAAAAYGAACAMGARPRHGLSPIAAGLWLALLTTGSTLLFVGTYFGFEYHWYWSAQVMLAGMFALAWTGAGLVGPAAAAREAEAQVATHRKARIAAQMGEMVAAVRRNAAVEAAVFIRAAESLAEEVRLLPSSVAGVEAALMLTEITRWLEGASRVSGPQTPGPRLQELSQEAGVLRRRFAQWRRY